ncbi:MAG: transcription termination/antitermination factor NusG [Pirellulales bacterium]|nr:transcription termination/antitermination factor NusG [Pirellulales bacterium]
MSEDLTAADGSAVEAQAAPLEDELADATADAVDATDSIESTDESSEEVLAEAEPEEAPAPAAKPMKAAEAKKDPPGPVVMDWYILKVQSNRERSIADALRRKIKIEGLDKYFGDVVVPTEKVTEFKGGKKKVVERKLYPGYIVVHMCINDDTWFAVRETSGIGDFTGSGGKPTPMLAHEVARIIHKEEEQTDEAPKLDIKFKLEDKVKVKDGTFEGFEGDVSAIDEQSGKITVMLSIFGRSTPVELEYWQVEGV